MSHASCGSAGIVSPTSIIAPATGPFMPGTTTSDPHRASVVSQHRHAQKGCARKALPTSQPGRK
jgi:hypothetical protein